MKYHSIERRAVILLAKNFFRPALVKEAEFFFETDLIFPLLIALLNFDGRFLQTHF